MISLVSFVIPAHNEQTLIARTIDAIHASCAVALHTTPYEVVVADDASTDATAEIVRSHATRSTRVVSIDRRQIAAARNAGTREATGDLLIFVDADTLVTPSIVRGGFRVIARGGIGGGASIRFDGKIPFYARLSLEPLVILFRIFKYTGGCFLFCTRTAYEAVGGWDETLFASEEITMCRQLKKQGRFVILHDRVITSGRKLRTHSLREIVTILATLTFKGAKTLKQREGLDLWYGERRDDPAPPSSPRP